MSWSDNNNNDPWGSSGNGSGRRGSGPNMDDVIRNAQNKFKGMMPGSFFGKLGPMVIIGILILIWLVSGFYRVCLLYTSPSPRDATLSRMPSSA